MQRSLSVGILDIGCELNTVFLLFGQLAKIPNAMGGVESAAVEDVVDVAIIGPGNPGKQGVFGKFQNSISPYWC